MQKDERQPQSHYGAPAGLAHGGGGAALGGVGGGARQVIVIDQSMHERLDTVERMLQDQKNVLDRVLQTVLRGNVPGSGAGGVGGFGSGGTPGSDAAAAEAIAQVSAHT